MKRLQMAGKCLSLDGGGHDVTLRPHGLRRCPGSTAACFRRWSGSSTFRQGHRSTTLLVELGCLLGGGRLLLLLITCCMSASKQAGGEGRELPGVQLKFMQSYDFLLHVPAKRKVRGAATTSEQHAGVASEADPPEASATPDVTDHHLLDGPQGKIAGRLPCGWTSTSTQSPSRVLSVLAQRGRA